MPGIAWTRWDRRQLVRAALTTVLTLGLAWLVTARPTRAACPGASAPGERCRWRRSARRSGRGWRWRPCARRGEALALGGARSIAREIAAARGGRGPPSRWSRRCGPRARARGRRRGVLPDGDARVRVDWTARRSSTRVHGLRVAADGAPRAGRGGGGRGAGVACPPYGARDGGGGDGRSRAWPCRCCSRTRCSGAERVRPCPLVVAAAVAVGGERAALPGGRGAPRARGRWARPRRWRCSPWRCGAIVRDHEGP